MLFPSLEFLVFFLPGSLLAYYVTPPRARNLVLLALSSLAVVSCGGREFRTEREVLAHFQEHRQSFERVAELFLAMQTPTIEIPEEAAGDTDNILVELARELRVSDISAVPGVAPTNEQWVQFRLRQRLLTSSYGLIFVPESHGAALESIKAQVDSPPRSVRLVRSIRDRWFYFDHD